MAEDTIATDSQRRGSYSQILKSSSIIGGAQGINYLIGMMRTKLVAILLGPSGVGLVGLYMSATGLVATVAGMGIGSSGVREIAEAHGCGNPEVLARTLKTLRRICWVTGIFGWALTAALAYPLSLWTFGSPERASALALLGVTLLFGSISGGQTALVQGTRRIGDLARLNVIGVAAGTVVAVGLYWWLGQKGIVPVLILTAAINLSFSWWFARKVQVIPVMQSFAETWKNSKRLVGLGMAFMWSGLLTAATGLAIRSIIVRDFGLDANGVYQAAWGISGMFAGFVLGAMGMDFYPRLTAIANDQPAMARLVNEQTEIGILLALPGLVGTLIFAPWVVRLFYTAKFLPGAELLPWFVLGVFVTIISWPMGYIMLALGSGKWFVLTETIALGVQLGLAVLFLNTFGLWGAALAYFLVHIVSCILVFGVSAHLIRFRWSYQVLRMLLETTLLVGVAFAARRFLPEWAVLVAGAFLTATAGLYTLRGLASRLGTQHRLVLLACRFPGGRIACGV